MATKASKAPARKPRVVSSKSKQKQNKFVAKLAKLGRGKLLAIAFVAVFGIGGVIYTLTSNAYTVDSTTWNTYANGLRQCESSNNYSNNDTGGNGHYGAYQFSHSTWAWVGGTAYSYNANGSSKAVQDYFAYKLFRVASNHFGQWECWTNNIYPTRYAWWGNPYHYSSTGSLSGTTTSTTSSANPYTVYCPTGSEATVGYGYTTSGSCVKKLQWDLNHLVSAGLTIDGSFGSLTYNAVKKYQSLHSSLTVDGVCGPATWASLDVHYP